MWPWLALMYLVGVGSFSHFTWISATELLLFTFPLNLYLYGLNDLYDTESDRLSDRKGGAQGIAPNDGELAALRKFVWVSPVLLLVVAALSGNVVHFALAFAFVLLCFTYSHPSVRAKGIPVLDCLNSAAGYCIPGLIAYSLHAPLSALPPAVFFIVLAYMGIHAMTTIIDEDADRRAGTRTIGVVFGKRGTIIFALCMFAASLVVFRNSVLLASIFFVSVLHGFVFLAVDNKHDDKLFRFAAPAVLISFMMVAMVYFIIQANVA